MITVSILRLYQCLTLQNYSDFQNLARKQTLQTVPFHIEPFSNPILHQAFCYLKPYYPFIIQNKRLPIQDCSFHK